MLVTIKIVITFLESLKTTKIIAYISVVEWTMLKPILANFELKVPSKSTDPRPIALSKNIFIIIKIIEYILSFTLNLLTSV